MAQLQPRRVGLDRGPVPVQRNSPELRQDPVPTWETAGGQFPDSPAWEITPGHALAWFAHNFVGRRGDTNLFRSLGDLSGHEFALLLWDLDCYAGLVRDFENGLRKAPPPPLHVYLHEGRETWGWIAELIREFHAERADR